MSHPVCPCCGESRGRSRAADRPLPTSCRFRCLDAGRAGRVARTARTAACRSSSPSPIAASARPSRRWPTPARRAAPPPRRRAHQEAALAALALARRLPQQRAGRPGRSASRRRPAAPPGSRCRPTRSATSWPSCPRRPRHLVAQVALERRGSLRRRSAPNSSAWMSWDPVPARAPGRRGRPPAGRAPRRWSRRTPPLRRTTSAALCRPRRSPPAAVAGPQRAEHPSPSVPRPRRPSRPARPPPRGRPGCCPGSRTRPRCRRPPTRVHAAPVNLAVLLPPTTTRPGARSRWSSGPVRRAAVSSAATPSPSRARPCGL